MENLPEVDVNAMEYPPPQDSWGFLYAFLNSPAPALAPSHGWVIFLCGSSAVVGAVYSLYRYCFPKNASGILNSTRHFHQLQYSLGNFSQSLNAWLATFLRDLGQASSMTAEPSSIATSTANEPVLSQTTASRTASTAQASSTAAPSSGNGQLAVYFGQTPGTQPGSLLPLCQNPDIDIIILAFVDASASYGGYPSINLGGACWPPDSKSAAAKANAQGLLNCTDIGTQIQSCQQQYHKKILLSIGGAISSIIFANSTDASNFARSMWSLFGAGHAADKDLRPFGTDVIVDGFDVDNEDNRPEYWDDFATELRSLYTIEQGRTGRKFYLSAAPQCPIPDASIPVGLMHAADFV
ncbi:MAG: hypothetical protein Q9159_004172 [Coniocarpon cinnabarinum]